VCLYDDGKIIGMGRIVGDGSIYFYLQDVIVMPSYRGCGYGKLIVEELVKYVTSLKHDNSFVGLMSAIGTKEFYNKLGFTERPSERPGMSMIVNGNEEKYAHLSS
jgi:GNAT superfamily N-acetyltransferase